MVSGCAFLWISEDLSSLTMLLIEDRMTECALVFGYAFETHEGLLCIPCELLARILCCFLVLRILW
jgi:hypothetical protein